MRHIILAAIEKGLPALNGAAQGALIEHVLAQTMQTMPAPVLPKVAPPQGGPLLSRPMAPKPQARPQPTGVHPNDQGMPMAEWSPQSEKHVKDSVKQMLTQFFSQNGITEPSVSTEEITNFLGNVDQALSGLFQRMSVDDENKLDQVHENYDAEKALRDQLQKLRGNFYHRPQPKERSLEHGIDPNEQRGPNFAAAKDGIVKIQTLMLDLADEADKAGMEEKADAVANVLPDINIVKFAQFESAQPYWMLNSRAFELAVKERKKEKKPDDFTAEPAEDGEGWHEAWWKTLEEYQDALMGEHEDFLKKHASKEHKANRYADEFMLIKIADRMGEGKSPGVAFYEAMDDLVSGEYIFDVLARATAVADGIHSEAANAGNEVLAAKAKAVEAGIADWLGNWVGKMVSPVGKGLDWAGNQAGEFGYGLHRGFGGQLMEQAARIRDSGQNVWSLIRALKQGNRYSPDQFAAEMSEILPVIDRFISLANKAGAGNLPKPGALLNWIKANKSIGQLQGETFGKIWQVIWNLSEPERAAALQKTLDKSGKGKQSPTAKPNQMPRFQSPAEIQSVMKSIRENLNLLTDEGDRRKAFKMLMSLRTRLESMKSRRVAAVKVAATREEISQWLMGILGDKSYEFANAVGNGFESALARPTNPANPMAPKSPTAPTPDATVPGSQPVDDLELQPISKKPAPSGPSPVAPVDDLELQPTSQNPQTANPDFPSKKDRRMWRLPGAKGTPAPGPSAVAPSPVAPVPSPAPSALPVAAPAVPGALPSAQKVSPRAKKPFLGRGVVPKL